MHIFFLFTSIESNGFALQNWDFHIFFKISLFSKILHFSQNERFCFEKLKFSYVLKISSFFKNFEFYKKERFCFNKLKFSYFLKIFIIFQHFGQHDLELKTKVSSTTRADTHTKLNFNMISMIWMKQTSNSWNRRSLKTWKCRPRLRIFAAPRSGQFTAARCYLASVR